MAKKPKTTITAIAQRGNELSPPAGWTLPVEPGRKVVGVPLMVVTNGVEADAEEREAEMEEDDEAAAREEEEAAAANESDVATESKTVV